MAINFPDPSASPWYNDPTTGGNGITYEYTTEGYWKAVDVTGNNAIDEGTGNALYVNKVGDNMTGDLTLGTDRITLNAGTGAATFAGNINIGDVDGTNTVANGTLLYESGNVYIQRSALAIATEPCITQLYGGSINDRVFETLTDGSVFIGGSPNNSSRTPNISLFADGSATFAGNVDLGSYTAFGTGAGFRLSSGGQLNINRAANNTAIQIAEVGDATPKVVIDSSGSSTFRGSLRNGAADDNVAVIGETGIYQSYRSDATSKACFQTFVATAPTTPTSQIFSNGSAEFKGTVDVTSGGYIFIGRRSSDDTAMFAVNDSGLVNIGPISGSDSNIVLNGSEGTATFASGSVNVSTVSNEGRLNVIRTDAGKAFAVNSSTSSTETIAFLGDGSANFASSAEFGVISSSPNSTGVLVGPINSQLSRVSIYNQTLGTAVCFQVRSANEGGTKSDRCTITTNGAGYFKSGVTSDGTFRVNLDPDNPANYTTTTDSEGNTTEVYNGPTLDVKERLQTKTAALEAIKTAAEDASITSLADFKSAIATALANI